MQQTMDSSEKLNQRLAKLKGEHKDLDDIISRLDESWSYDLLQIQRLKKHKLALKGYIVEIENKILPDIIA